MAKPNDATGMGKGIEALTAAKMLGPGFMLHDLRLGFQGCSFLILGIGTSSHLCGTFSGFPKCLHSYTATSMLLNIVVKNNFPHRAKASHPAIFRSVRGCPKPSPPPPQLVLGLDPTAGTKVMRGCG